MARAACRLRGNRRRADLGHGCGDGVPGQGAPLDPVRSALVRESHERPPGADEQGDALSSRARRGRPLPWTIPVSRPEELLYAGATADYPCIIKPALSYVGKAVGNYRTRRIDSERELLSSVGAALEDGVAMLCTEYVPGGEENLEGAVTLRGADGRYLLEYGRRKLRQHPIDFGSGSLLCSAHVPETLALAKRLVESVDFVGVSSFEAKLHAVTGERVLTEINVRVPLNFGLGDAAGVEASWRLYAGMAGLPLEDQPRQRDDRKVVIPWLDARAVKTRFSRGELRLRGLLQSYKGTRSAGVLDPRDPGPGIAMAGRMLSERRNRSAPRSDSTEASSRVDRGRRRGHTATPAR